MRSLSLEDTLSAVGVLPTAASKPFLYLLLFAFVRDDSRFTAEHRAAAAACRDGENEIFSVHVLKDLGAEDLKQLGSFMTKANRNKLHGLVDALMPAASSLPVGHSELNEGVVHPPDAVGGNSIKDENDAKEAARVKTEVKRLIIYIYFIILILMIF